MDFEWDLDRVGALAQDIAAWQATTSEEELRSSRLQVYEVARRRYESGERLDASTYRDRLYGSIANAERAVGAVGQESVGHATHAQIALISFFDYEARYGHNSAEDEALAYELWNTVR